MKCSSLRYLWSTMESLTANLLVLLGEQGICLTKSVFNNGICWGIEEGGSKVNIHSSAVHITAHVGNHKIFPFPGLFARLSPFRTTTCLQMAWNSSGEYAARRRLSQKTLPYLLVCRPQPLRGGGTGGWQPPASRTPFSRLPYLFVPLSPDSRPLLYFSRHHVN